ncbi:STM3941 family protein [Oceanobacillus luteolus]|uniref:STM3941 family protein n=1 Tax=Oceanobacillus luteolus TaxID=1274358 RepID=A0ABW4HUG8_9BACI
MIHDKIEFYHSKGKLFLGIIFSLLFVAMGTFLIYVAYIESILIFFLILFTIVMLSFFAGANILKMFRGYPYIIITEEYIQLDPFTKSEVTIYFSDIENIKISEVSFQKILEIVLYEEDDYFAQLSLHNKIRLFMNRVTGFSLFTIGLNAIRKKERSALLGALDFIIQQKISIESTFIETAQKHHKEVDLLEKYNPTPEVERSINRSYFLKSYSHGFMIFALSFIFFYLLLGRNNNYLSYIIFNFIIYPFAKVLIDWLFGFKFRHKIEKQKGVTYYFKQLLYMFDFILFHVSFLIAPFGILFLLIRMVVIRIKR